MAFDEGSAERLRDLLADTADTLHTDERKMFGGLAFMRNGHMMIGLIKDDLMVRVGKDNHADLMKKAHARAMDFTGRPMKGYIFVASDGYAEDDTLAYWLQQALNFNNTLEPK